MIGESLLAAPWWRCAGARSVSAGRPVARFLDRESYAGKQRVKVAAPLDRIPVFVKSGTLLPLAQPTLHTADRRVTGSALTSSDRTGNGGGV